MLAHFTPGLCTHLDLLKHSHIPFSDQGLFFNSSFRPSNMVVLRQRRVISSFSIGLATVSHNHQIEVLVLPRTGFMVDKLWFPLSTIFFVLCEWGVNPVHKPKLEDQQCLFCLASIHVNLFDMVEPARTTRVMCGVTVCFPSMPPMLLHGFESRLGLESLGCSMWHFLKLVARGFLRALRFPPLLHWFNGSANKIKLK